MGVCGVQGPLRQATLCLPEKRVQHISKMTRLVKRTVHAGAIKAPSLLPNLP